mmetsp:Transcript_23403/g.50686  ORF Transcript_23403/g.50686 Transcript_23403/m.50686 type:complete len:252 (-) Transcript_23403:89-844(-)
MYSISESESSARRDRALLAVAFFAVAFLAVARFLGGGSSKSSSKSSSESSYFLRDLAVVFLAVVATLDFFFVGRSSSSEWLIESSSFEFVLFLAPALLLDPPLSVFVSFCAAFFFSFSSAASSISISNSARFLPVMPKRNSRTDVGLSIADASPSSPPPLARFIRIFWLSSRICSVLIDMALVSILSTNCSKASPMLFSSNNSNFLSLFTKFSVTKSSILMSSKFSGSTGTSSPAAPRFFFAAFPPLEFSA